MCGITGFIDLKKQTDVEVLTSMTDTLYHRGPDGSGVEVISTNNATIGLGHRRLSIIDLTSYGKQPMQFENYWICFNGEVYNYAEIKKELTELGHVFSGNSDTEVILHAFAQ
jgi:asparagine synthase (glutamine-hydrolysing)